MGCNATKRSARDGLGAIQVQFAQFLALSLRFLLRKAACVSLSSLCFALVSLSLCLSLSKRQCAVFDSRPCNTLYQMDQPKSLDFSVIGEPLNNLLIATGNKLSREWPAKYSNVIGARELFVIHLRVAHMTYLSALYIGEDKLQADERRLSEIVVSLPLLNRAILDSLFTLLFTLEDVPDRCAWFRESDWKASRLELDRYVAEYGDSDLPEWKSYLEDLSKACDMGLALTNLTPAQTANPKALRSWPNPVAMVKRGVSPNASLSPLQEVRKYLNDFFYTDLSQQAKLGGWGIAKRGTMLLDEIRVKPGIEDQIRKFRYAHMGQAVALVLALASEIEAHFKFGLRQDVLYVWNVAAPVIFVVNEMYDKRYKSLLGQNR